MAAAFEFTNDGMDQHHCRTWQEGDWIVLQCTQCNFLRRMNWKTGKLLLDRVGQTNALHTARHQPGSLSLKDLSLN